MKNFDANSSVTRYERSKRGQRAWLAAGVIFGAKYIYVLIVLPELVLEKAPFLISLAVVPCIVCFGILPAMFFCFGLRKVASHVELAEEGIRNPTTGEEWLPWHRVDEIKRRWLFLRYEIFGEDTATPVLIGWELPTSDILMEILRRASVFRERATGRRQFECQSIAQIFFTFLGLAVLSFLLVNGQVEIFMKTFGPILAVCAVLAVLCIPIRLQIDTDSVTLRYPLWTSRILLSEFESVRYTGSSVVLQHVKPRQSKQIHIRQDSQDAYFSCLESWERARGIVAVTA